MLCILTDVSNKIITHLRLAKPFYIQCYTVTTTTHHPHRLFHLNISSLVGQFYIIRTTYSFNTFRE